MKFLDYIMDTKQLGSHPYRKILIALALCIVIAIAFSLLLISGSRIAPFLLIFGGLTFAPIFLLIWILLVGYAICQNIYLFRYHRVLFKKQFARGSLKQRHEVSLQIRNLKDPYLERFARRSNSIGMWAFKIWIGVYIVIVITVIALNKLGYLDRFFE